MLEKREFDQNDFFWRLSTAITVVSGLFSVIVFLLLIINYLQVEAADPVDNLLITKMRQEYAALPQQDPALAERIRDLELLNRKAFFTSQYFLRTGATLLLIGVCVFLIAAKYSIRWKRVKPKLDDVPTADQEFLAFAESRQLISWAAVTIIALGLAAAFFTERTVAKENTLLLSQTDKAPAKPVAAAGAAKTETAKNETSSTAPAAGAASAAPTPGAPTWDTIEKNWPSFRGPGSGGTAYFKTAPTDWDIAANKNVKWKADVPLPGANSPVVWDNKLFLSGADEKTREIYCYNVDDGKQLWKATIEALPGAPAAPPKVSEDTGFAAPSMVAHGGQVFAIFAEGDLVSYDMDGKKVWAKNIGMPSNHYGHSSSLLAYDKFLYVQLDQKTDPKLMALDVKTGNELWTVKRKAISWASPVLAQTTFGPELVLCSETTVDAYDPMTGAQKWTQECLSGEVAPSPAYSNGVVFAANEYAKATAIQLDKSDSGVTPKVLWEFDELLPEVSSPVGDGERFYFGTSSGHLVCLDAKTGKKLWDQELVAGFYSSPVLVGDKLYVLDKEGHMYIVKASGTYELIAQRDTGEATFATPAFLDGRIYLRTGAGHLYCIEQKNA